MCDLKSCAEAMAREDARGERESRYGGSGIRFQCERLEASLADLAPHPAAEITMMHEALIAG